MSKEWTASDNKASDPFRADLGGAPPLQDDKSTLDTADLERGLKGGVGEGADGATDSDLFADFFDNVCQRLGLNSFCQIDPPFGRIAPPLGHQPIDDVLGSLPPRGGSAAVRLVSESKLRTLLTSAVSLLDTEPTLSVNADVARSLINLALDEITPK